MIQSWTNVSFVVSNYYNISLHFAFTPRKVNILRLNYLPFESGLDICNMCIVLQTAHPIPLNQSTPTPHVDENDSTTKMSEVRYQYRHRNKLAHLS